LRNRSSIILARPECKVLGASLNIKVYNVTGASFTIKGYGAMILAKVRSSMNGVCVCINGYEMNNLLEPQGVTVSFNSSSHELTITDEGGTGFDFVCSIGYAFQ